MKKTDTAAVRRQGRILRLAAALAYVLALGACLLALGACESQSRRVRDIVIPRVDPARLQDGEYVGVSVYRDTPYRVRAVVRNREIVSLDVLADEGDEYDLQARAVLERAVAAQSLEVDAVSGATRSSKLHLMAAYNALTGETIEY